MAIVWGSAEAVAGGLGGTILLGALLLGFLVFATYSVMKAGECVPEPVCLNCADYVAPGSNGLEEVEPCEGPVEPPPV